MAIAGERLLAYLFAVLAGTTLVVLLFFAALAPEAARPRVYMALAGNLLAALVAFLLVRWIGRRRSGLPEEPDAE